MITVHPYLTFNGNCERAFDFYKSVFGGEFIQVSRFKDMPPADGQKIPDDHKEKILHVSLPLGKGSVLMGSDSNPSMGDVRMGENISLSINADTKEDAGRIFTALSAGGKITMPIGDTFWGAYFGMMVDKFGVIWMVNHDYKK
jgi:PhnB protein